MKSFKHPSIKAVSLEQVLYALSDPVRLGIVRKLAKNGEASCAELDGGRPKSTMSHHFKVLRAAGLVCTRSEGTTHLNSVRSAELNERFPNLLKAILSAEKKAR